MALRILRLVAIAYAAFAAIAFVAQRKLAFPGTFRDSLRLAATAPAGVEQLWLEASFGRVEAWFFAAVRGQVEADGFPPTLIFAHGNGELIDDWAPEMKILAEAGINALAVEFPGYGYSEGAPKRSTIRESFEAAFDALSAREDVDPNRIIVHGRSMGGGAAGDLALSRPVAALILQSTFSSTARIAWEVMMPGFLVLDRFDNVAAIRGFDGPILLMHGPTDDVIPFAHGQRLAAARGGLTLHEIDCAHNDCGRIWPDVVARVADFLGEHELLHR